MPAAVRGARPGASCGSDRENDPGKCPLRHYGWAFLLPRQAGRGQERGRAQSPEGHCPGSGDRGPVTYKQRCQGRRETLATPPAAQRCRVPARVPSRQRRGQCRQAPGMEGRLCAPCSAPIAFCPSPACPLHPARPPARLQQECAMSCPVWLPSLPRASFRPGEGWAEAACPRAPPRRTAFPIQCQWGAGCTAGPRGCLLLEAGLRAAPRGTELATLRPKASDCCTCPVLHLPFISFMHYPWIATCQCICMYIAVHNGENLYKYIYIHTGGAVTGCDYSFGFAPSDGFLLPNTAECRMVLLLFVWSNKRKNNKTQTLPTMLLCCCLPQGQDKGPSSLLCLRLCPGAEISGVLHALCGGCSSARGSCALPSSPPLLRREPGMAAARGTGR